MLSCNFAFSILEDVLALEVSWSSISGAEVAGTLRHRLHGRGLKSKRFHDLDTASKSTRFQGVYTEPIQPLNPTVYVKAISFSGLCTSSVGARFDQTRVRRLSSPRPNPESSLAFLFVTLQERVDGKANISKHLCLYLCGVALGL